MLSADQNRVLGFHFPPCCKFIINGLGFIAVTNILIDVYAYKIKNSKISKGFKVIGKVANTVFCSSTYIVSFITNQGPFCVIKHHFCTCLIGIFIKRNFFFLLFFSGECEEKPSDISSGIPQ